MAKAATVQARVEMKLKKQVDIVLKKIGVSTSQVINALYAQIVMHKGIPFELKIPSEATQDAINELESGKGKRFSTFKEMLDDVEEEKK